MAFLFTFCLETLLLDVDKSSRCPRFRLLKKSMNWKSTIIWQDNWCYIIWRSTCKGSTKMFVILYKDLMNWNSNIWRLWCCDQVSRYFEQSIIFLHINEFIRFFQLFFFQFELTRIWKQSSYCFLKKKL